MSENQNEDGLMVLTGLIVVIVIVHKNSEAIFKFLELLFIGIGKLILIGFCGFLVFLILKGVFMSLVKLKNTIDALKEWKDSVDKKIVCLEKMDSSLSREISSIDRSEDKVYYYIKDLYKEIKQLKEFTGMEENDLVKKAEQEVLDAYT